MSSTATPDSQSRQANYNPTGNSQVHSAGCIKNGRAICVCDRPASRLISRTQKNPGRAFYICAHGNCRFWRWEDELLAAGLIPPTDDKPAPPKTPQSSCQGVFSGNANANTLSSPQSAKRSYARMSTGGSRHVPHSVGGTGGSARAKTQLSDEAKLAEKKRREAEIQAALDKMKAEDDEENMNGFDESDLDVGVDVDAQVGNAGGNAEDERGLFHPDYASSDEEQIEGSGLPASKKSRLTTVKTEELDGGVTPFPPFPQSLSQTQRQPQEQTPAPSTPPPRPITSTSIQLPTPSQTVERRRAVDTDVDDLYADSGSVPPSPTSFTKGGQRAREKEQKLLSNNGVRDAGVSTSSLAPLNKGKVSEVEEFSGESSTNTGTNANANTIDGNPLQMEVDPERQTQATAKSTANVGPFSKFFRGLSRVLTAPTSVQNPRSQASYQSALVDTHVPNSGSAESQEQERERERERRSEYFAIQLASTIERANSSPRTPLSNLRSSHARSLNKAQNSARNSKELRRSTSICSGLSSSWIPVPPLITPPISTLHEQQKDTQTPSHPTRLPSPSSALVALLSKMTEHQAALQTAASNMAAQQMTFQAAVHDFMGEYDKLDRRVKELEGVVQGKERENAGLTGIVDELRKRNAELEAFHHGLEQLFQSGSPTSVRRTPP